MSKNQPELNELGIYHTQDTFSARTYMGMLRFADCFTEGPIFYRRNTWIVRKGGL